MNIASVINLTELSRYGSTSTPAVKESGNAAFENVLQSAMNMVNQTKNLTNAAEEAEMSFSLGITDNTHDLQVAQEKANLSLQYTVAVRNQVLDAYKEIMAIQF